MPDALRVTPSRHGTCRLISPPVRLTLVAPLTALSVALPHPDKLVWGVAATWTPGGSEIVNARSPTTALRFRLFSTSAMRVVPPGTIIAGENDRPVPGGTVPCCPCSVMANGPALLEPVKVVLNTPAVVGVKVKVYWQLA